MNGRTKIRLRKLIYAGTVGLIIAAAIGHAKDESHQNYFPLAVGNSWTYTDGTEQKTFTIVGVQEINGQTYYKFDDYFSLCWPQVTWEREVLFRYDSASDRVLMCLSRKEVTRYGFSGDLFFALGDGLIDGHLVQTGVSCNVLHREFDNCLSFKFVGIDCGPDAYGFGEYLAPNVGIIKFVVPGGPCIGGGPEEGDRATFQLQSYTIKPFCGDPNHPYPVGDLNHDCRVDMLDLAILISHWLEDRRPVSTVTIKLPLGAEGRYDVNSPYWQTDFDLGVTFTEISHVYMDWSGTITGELTNWSGTITGELTTSGRPDPGNTTPLDAQFVAKLYELHPHNYFGWADVRGGAGTYPGPEPFDLLSEFTDEGWSALLDGRGSIEIWFGGIARPGGFTVEYPSGQLDSATLVVEGTIVPEPASIFLFEYRNTCSSSRTSY